MSIRSKVKKIIIVLVVLAALVAGAAAGAPALAQRSAGEVDVYPVADLITNADWATDAQIEGVVTKDENQSVYISSTEQVREVYVVEGQTVKVGDPILAFDTTLTDLELERQRVRVEELKVDIRDTEKELREIAALRPGSSAEIDMPFDPPVESDPAETPPDVELESVPYLPYEQRPGALGTWDDPLVFLWNDECLFSQSFFRELAALAMERRETAVHEAEDDPDGAEQIDDESVFVIFEVRIFDALDGELIRVWEMELTPDGEGKEWTFREFDPMYPEPEEGDPDFGSDPDMGLGDEIYDDYIDIGDFSDFGDTGPVYTAAEIAELRQDCTNRLKDLNQELKMAELTYESLQYEISNGEVVSKIDGVVTVLIDADEARLENKPMVVISCGGGYYVTAALGEMDLSTLSEGESVMVQSWENNRVAEGRITEVSEYPDDSGMFWYYSNGNRNVSLYPFEVYVDAAAELREGEYVTILPVGRSIGSGAMFLDMSFVRQENGKSYVYGVGEDGLLERRDVKTGRNLWGSYVEILDGLTQEESIAFPYGRKVHDGAKVRFAEIHELYETMYR